MNNISATKDQATASRYSNLNFLKLPDCDGLLENGKCNCLDVPACRGENCPSYHNKDSIKKAFVRLRSLEEGQQEHISQKYYGGKRPWTESGANRRGKYYVQD